MADGADQCCHCLFLIVGLWQQSNLYKTFCRTLFGYLLGYISIGAEQLFGSLRILLMLTLILLTGSFYEERIIEIDDMT